VVWARNLGEWNSAGTGRTPFIVSGGQVKAYGEDVDDYRRVNFFGV
jgi:hypothetical protein